MFFLKKKTKIVIRHRSEHVISRKNIAPEALKVLYRLSDAGYKAYLVGGGVRDLLLGRTPKDFDVCTDARPKEIKRLFPRCFLVGRRFRLAHVVFGKTVIETSTFRKQPDGDSNNSQDDAELYQQSDNTFGSPEEDALRRDFTVNGLFYDIRTFDIIDYVGGLADLDKKLLRSIGNPDIRFKEDPVRMMRAIRLSAKLGLKIERTTLKAISRQYHQIEKASTPRILEEIFRLFSFPASETCFRMLWETKLLSVLMPELYQHIERDGKKKCAIWRYLAQLDKVVAHSNEETTNGLRLAVLVLSPYLTAMAKQSRPAREMPRHQRLALAETTLNAIISSYSVPRTALFHATHMLEELVCFDKKPPHNRTIRASRASQFADSLLLARIRAAADNISTESIDAWSGLRIVSTPAHPTDAIGEEDDGNFGDAGSDEAYENSGFRPRRRRVRTRKPPQRHDNMDSVSPTPNGTCAR